MEQRQKTRSEIEEKYKWDLTPIYKDVDSWYEDYDLASKEIKKVLEFKGNIVKNAKNLLDYIEFSMNLERKLYKLYYYAHLNFDSDTTNDEYQKMNGKIENLLAEYNRLDSFANPEMMKIDYSQVKEFYKEEPKLQEYEFLLEQLYRYKDHILNTEAESII